MTLDEAIEEHEYIVNKYKLRRGPRSIEAIRLGIEALKEVERARGGNPALDSELLPGETNE